MRSHPLCHHVLSFLWRSLAGSGRSTKVSRRSRAAWSRANFSVDCQELPVDCQELALQGLFFFDCTVSILCAPSRWLERGGPCCGSGGQDERRLASALAGEQGESGVTWMCRWMGFGGWT